MPAIVVPAEIPGPETSSPTARPPPGGLTANPSMIVDPAPHIPGEDCDQRRRLGRGHRVDVARRLARERRLVSAFSSGVPSAFWSSGSNVRIEPLTYAQTVELMGVEAPPASGVIK